MFARVLNTAKRILSRSPPVQAQPDESPEATPAPTSDADADADMVSTRSGTDVTPRSVVRKTKRGLETEDTPSKAKKRRMSMAVEEQVEDAEKDKAPQVDGLGEG